MKIDQDWESQGLWQGRRGVIAGLKGGVIWVKRLVGYAWQRVVGLVLVLLLSACQAPAVQGGPSVQVSRAVSGQTLEVLDLTQPTALTSPVRLIGVEAPDLKQEPWGVAAKQQLQEWVGNKSVTLEFDLEPTDCWGRQLAYVWLDDQLLNERLIEAGLVLASTRSPNIKYEQRLANAQEKARLLGVGIWNPENPMRQSPAEFRRDQSDEVTLSTPSEAIAPSNSLPADRLAGCPAPTTP